MVLGGSKKPLQPRAKVVEQFHRAMLRHAIRGRRQLQIIYKDRDGCTTDRIIWPLPIAFLDRTQYLVGSRETKEDHRHFKTERIQGLSVLEQNDLALRAALLKG